MVTDLAGVSLPVERLDKQTWRIRHGGKGFRAPLPGVGRRARGAHQQRSTTATPPSTPPACSSTSSARPRARPSCTSPACRANWTVHGALPQPTPGALRAASYDVLVDSPLELGTPVVHAWDEGGTRVELVFSAPGGSNADAERLARELKPVVHAFAEAMGGLPTRRYVFLMLADEKGDGGLEHADSTLMRARSRTCSKMKAGYRRALHLASHEFFHLWNAKRLRDAALVPYDYSREDYSELLWFHEGFTETVENLILVRAGVTSPDEFLRELGDLVDRLPAEARAQPRAADAEQRRGVGQARTSRRRATTPHRSATTKRATSPACASTSSCACARRARARSSALFRRLMASHGAKGSRHHDRRHRRRRVGRGGRGHARLLPQIHRGHRRASASRAADADGRRCRDSRAVGR